MMRHNWLKTILNDVFFHVIVFDVTYHLESQKYVRKLEHKGKAIFDIPFMMQSHAESTGSPLGSTR